MSATAQRIAGTFALAAIMGFGGSAVAQNRLPVNPNDKYGSIAYSPADGRSGYSYDYRTEAEAVQAAMGYCRQDGGKSCRTVMWVSNGCGAIAIAGKNRDFAVANGKYRPEAEANALRFCQQDFRRSCTIKVWVCTSP